MSTIHSRAMLADLHIRCWEGRRRDPQVTQETLAACQAKPDAGIWRTRIVPTRLFRGIVSASTAGREAHRKMTLPWSDEGPRILPATVFLEYTTEMRKLESRFREEVAEFLRLYPDEVRNAKQRLGKLYQPNIFPTVERLRRTFDWKISFSPLPDAKDFRVDLETEQVEVLRQQVQENLNQALSEAYRDLYRRIHQVVSKVVEKLTDQDAKFRDSLIRKVRDLCDVLPKLNVMDDPTLVSLGERMMKEIALQKPEDLRREPHTREKTAKAAADILSEVTSLLPQEDAV